MNTINYNVFNFWIKSYSDNHMIVIDDDDVADVVHTHILFKLYEYILLFTC